MIIHVHGVSIIGRYRCLKIILFLFDTGRQNEHHLRRTSAIDKTHIIDPKSHFTAKQFFHAPTAFYSDDKRSISIETQLPDSNIISAKATNAENRFGKLSKKRSLPRSTSYDEHRATKAPKVYIFWLIVWLLEHLKNLTHKFTLVKLLTYLYIFRSH